MEFPGLEFLGVWEISILAPLWAATLVAGLVRGFSGFGAGLIFMPIASALIDPKLVVAAFLVIDFLLALPMVPPAMRKCDWPTVIPLIIAATLTVPLGAYALVNSDPILVRWGISIAALAMLSLLLSGWRYRGRPNVPASLGVGAAAGFLSGIAQIPGPPVATYWMSGPLPTAIIRANLISFFFVESIVGTGTYFFNGLFTQQALALIIWLAPSYALAIWLGTRLHGRSTDKAYRVVAYSLIGIAGFTSMPALDWLLRGG